MLVWGVSAISGTRLGSHWKLRTIDKPFGFLVLLKAIWSAIRGDFIMKLLGLGLYLYHGRYIAGVVALWVVGHSGGFEYLRSGFIWQSS